MEKLSSFRIHLKKSVLVMVIAFFLFPQGITANTDNNHYNNEKCTTAEKLVNPLCK
jgi:hypothetical protein